MMDAPTTDGDGRRLAGAIATGVTREDVRSEEELLKSRDVLEGVVRACGLTARKKVDCGAGAGEG